MREMRMGKPSIVGWTAVGALPEATSAADGNYVIVYI